MVLKLLACLVLLGLLCACQVGMSAGGIRLTELQPAQPSGPQASVPADSRLPGLQEEPLSPTEPLLPRIPEVSEQGLPAALPSFVPAEKPGTLLTLHRLSETTVPAWPPVLGPDGKSYLVVGNEIRVWNSSGEQLQTLTLQDFPLGPPLVLPQGLFIADRSGFVYGFTLKGQRAWQRGNFTTASLNTLVLLDAQTLLASEQGNEVFGLDIASGAVKWIFDTKAFVGRVSVVGPEGRAYVTTHGAQLYALSPETGEMQWFFIADGPFSDVAVAFDGAGNGYLATVTGSVYALNRYGFQKWAFQYQEPFDFGVSTSPHGLVYAVSRSGVLMGLDAGNGKKVFQQALPAGLALPLLVGNDGLVYALLLSGEIWALDVLGEFFWSYQLPAGFKPVAMQLDELGRLHVTSQDSQWLQLQTSSPGSWKVHF